MRQEAFTYRSGISLGKGFVRPWSKVATFLAKAADSSDPVRVAIELVEDKSVPTHFFRSQRKILDESYDLYGWRGIGGGSVMHQWVIPTTDLEGQLSRLEELRPLPKFAFGPLWVNVRVDFKLIDEQGACLPWQDAEHYNWYVSKDKKEEALGLSRLDVFLSENSTMRLFLCLPFESRNNDLQGHVDFLNESTPFKLKPGMWKEWTITKNGRTYKKRKTTVHASTR